MAPRTSIRDWGWTARLSPTTAVFMVLSWSTNGVGIHKPATLCLLAPACPLIAAVTPSRRQTFTPSAADTGGSRLKSETPVAGCAVWPLVGTERGRRNVFTRARFPTEAKDSPTAGRCDASPNCQLVQIDLSAWRLIKSQGSFAGGKSARRAPHSCR